MNPAAQGSKHLRRSLQNIQSRYGCDHILAWYKEEDVAKQVLPVCQKLWTPKRLPH